MKNNKVIKLITLIIILLILIAIAIVILTGKNGLLNKIIPTKNKHTEISKKETTYVINSIDGNNMNITVTITNNTGIKKVITPNGNTIVLSNENKNKIAIDYDVVSGQDYIFKLQLEGESEEKDYILKANTESLPIIHQNESYTYPMLTEYGVKTNKKVEINYGEGTNNYYSIDDGQTWNRYTETININEQCTILAKTIIEGEITKVDKKDITLNLADGAIGPEAYDGDENTSSRGTFLVDPSLQGKTMRIYTYAGYSYESIGFINDDGETWYKGVAYGNDVTELQIPIGLSKVFSYSVHINEIKIVNEPTLNVQKVYPTLTENEVEPAHYTVSINYFDTSVEKLYSLDGITWKSYNEGEIITLHIDETIYAKGVDKYGVETPISSFKAKFPDDALDLEAYDGSDETYITRHVSNYGYINISNNLVGRKLRIFMGSGRGGNKIIFVDADGKVLLETDTPGEYIIPEGCVRIGYSAFYPPEGQYYWCRLFELGLVK